MDIRTEIKRFVNKMKMEYLDILPQTFGQLFEDLGLKVHDVYDEMSIPTVLCINGPVLNLLATYKTAIHINNYMKIAGTRDMFVASETTRVSVMILMLASVGYTFNEKTVPFLKNVSINQMWADIGQLAKAEHVGSVLIAVATRGRSCDGFARQHAPRMNTSAPNIIPVPSYVKGPNNNNIIRLNYLPYVAPVPAPPKPHELPKPKTLQIT